MLAGPDPLVILYMPCDSTQDDLLHQLPRHRVCCKKRKCKPHRSLQLDRRSRVRWARARVQARKQLRRNGAVTLARVLVTLTFGSTCPIIQLHLRLNKSVGKSTEDTTTFSFTPLGPCNSPVAIPHQKGSGGKPGALLAPYIQLHARLLHPARELLTHTRHFAAAGLMGFQEGITGNARPICTDIYRGNYRADELRSAACKLLLAGGISPAETQDGPTGGAAQPRASRSADHLGSPRRSLPFQHRPNTKLGEKLISAANETTVLETTMKGHEAYWLMVSMGLQGLTSGPTVKHRIQVSFLAAALLIQIASPMVLVRRKAGCSSNPHWIRSQATAVLLLDPTVWSDAGWVLLPDRRTQRVSPLGSAVHQEPPRLLPTEQLKSAWTHTTSSMGVQCRAAKPKYTVNRGKIPLLGISINTNGPISQRKAHLKTLLEPVRVADVVVTLPAAVSWPGLVVKGFCSSLVPRVRGSERALWSAAPLKTELVGVRHSLLSRCCLRSRRSGLASAGQRGIPGAPMDYTTAACHQRVNPPAPRDALASRDGDSTTSLGSLFQCLITLSVKKNFLISSLNLPWRNLRPFPLVLSLVTWEKRPTPPLYNLLSVVESDEVSPQPPFLQAEQPQVPQPLPISLVLQTLPQLRCPSLDTLQPLNVSLGVGGPTLNTAFEVRPHQCRVQGHDHCPSPAGHTVSDTSQDAIGFLGHLGTLLAHIQGLSTSTPRSFSARQLSSHSSPSL
ncbi:LOW QUALITY PROTEIN: hypothetical protein QYF61_000709 [Mycteria americana]|uniref:Uncharacterized protein n=1 Tax=Mycteria americana TaxID=33587 RepID=A0AAN7N5V0_MYCAM|nr:LOW QUALITY PROTEIN: hypothetical protein QYF61_000709 [Mycteria americana]